MSTHSNDPTTRALPPFPKILDGSTESTSAVLQWAGEAAQLIIDLRDAISELEDELDDQLIASSRLGSITDASRAVDQLAPAAPPAGHATGPAVTEPSHAKPRVSAPPTTEVATSPGAFESAWASEPDIDAAAADRFFAAESGPSVRESADSVDAFQSMLRS